MHIDFSNIQTASAVPRAAAMIETFRAIGYSLETAVADIIDNSISAEAKNIYINRVWKGGESIITIRDDGYGMSNEEIIQAMRPGAQNPLEERSLTDLGRFGLFLPGDLRDKLDPYLQPLYDALWDMMPMAKLLSYIEDKTIEIAPLAFMRGRTLDNAYVILDEAQNATESQMKMFLTRMGKNAKFFITGDLTQVDLPRHQHSGLIHASKILKDIKGIDFVYMDQSDVVRHSLVTKIIESYEKWSLEKAAVKEQKITEQKSDEQTTPQ